MGKVIKVVEPKGSRDDFSFIDKYGYPNTVGGISHMFNQAYWNYAKLISGVLRNGLPVEEVVHLVSSLNLTARPSTTGGQAWKEPLRDTSPTAQRIPRARNVKNAANGTGIPGRLPVVHELRLLQMQLKEFPWPQP